MRQFESDSALIAGVAQMAEQFTCNKQVRGSNPLISSKRRVNPIGDGTSLEKKRAKALVVQLHYSPPAVVDR